MLLVFSLCLLQSNMEQKARGGGRPSKGQYCPGCHFLPSSCTCPPTCMSSPAPADDSNKENSPPPATRRASMRLQQEEENKRKEIFRIAGRKGALTRWYVPTPPAFLPCEVDLGSLRDSWGWRKEGWC